MSPAAAITGSADAAPGTASAAALPATTASTAQKAIRRAPARGPPAGFRRRCAVSVGIVTPLFGRSGPPWQADVALGRGGLRGALTRLSTVGVRIASVRRLRPIYDPTKFR